MKQTTNTVLMVEPVSFGFNSETASSNVFQIEQNCVNAQKLALEESKNYVLLLREKGIKVIYVKDTLMPYTPDSLYPNNWFSTHDDGTLVLYPMCALNRRLERKQVFIDVIKENFKVKRILDLTYFEKDGFFLEGTGSLVFDRANKITYACRSIRTSEIVINEFCKKMGYQMIVFDACDENDKPIYHTNVILSIMKEFAVVCLDAIQKKEDRERIVNSLKDSNKRIIEISFKQMHSFAGNVIELSTNSNKQCIVMSKSAYRSFTREQISLLESNSDIVCPDLSNIERIGGGSARCMVAEIFHA